MCAGKTTVAALLHEKMPRSFLISGDRIKWFISDYDPERDRQTVAKLVISLTDRALEEGLSVITDANYLLWSETEIPQLYHEVFEKQGVEASQFNVEAPQEILVERLHARVRKNLAAGKKMSVTSQEKFLSYYEIYEAIKNPDLPTFDTSRMTSEEVAEKIFLMINPHA